MAYNITNLTASGARIAVGLPYLNSEAADFAALLGFYEKNKFPLVAFEPGHNGHDFFESAEFLAAREHQAKTLSSLRGEYILVRNRWLEEGIPCITIKSGEPFPAFPYTSDNLDILIHEENEATARAILEQLGYVELKNLEEPKKFLFRKFRGGELALDIHLHTRVGWGVCFMDGNLLWKGARVSSDDEAVIIPSAEDTILITLAHGFYENKKLRLADLIKVHICFQAAVDWQYMKSIARQTAWLDGLCFCIALCAHLEKVILEKASIPRQVLQECLAEIRHSPLINRYYYHLSQRQPVSLPFSVSFAFSKFLFYRKILNDRRESLPRRLYEVIRTLMWGIKLKGHIRPQAPFLVSFSGIDGSGKSSHAQLLEKCLAHYGLRTSYRWSRCATNGVTRLFSICGQALFWRRANSHKSEPTSATRRRQRLSNPLLRFFWSYLTAADMIISYFSRAGLPLSWGKIVICDRYVFDTAAEMESSLPVVDRWNKLAIRLMLALTRKPDIAYFLDVPGDISTQRRDSNFDADSMQRQRNVYIDLANLYHLRVIRTDRDFNDNTDEILKEVARTYFKRFPTFIRGLFFANPGQLNRKNS
jgi:thymidylate kinase